MTSDTITRDIVINASPETVYDVVSEPKHIANWFSDEADLEPVAGARGVLTFRIGERRTEPSVIEVTVVKRGSSAPVRVQLDLPRTPASDPRRDRRHPGGVPHHAPRPAAPAWP